MTTREIVQVSNQLLRDGPIRAYYHNLRRERPSRLHDGMPECDLTSSHTTQSSCRLVALPDRLARRPDDGAHLTSREIPFGKEGLRERIHLLPPKLDRVLCPDQEPLKVSGVLVVALR